MNLDDEVIFLKYTYRNLSFYLKNVYKNHSIWITPFLGWQLHVNL